MKVNPKEIYDDENFNEGADENRFTNPFKVILPDDFNQVGINVSLLRNL